MVLEAKKPVSMSPTKPPMPWMAKMSRPSSTRRRCLYFTVKKEAQDVSAPTNAAVSMGTKPQAGVMPTRPEMMPEQKPMMENLRVKRYSRATQARPPPEAARLVLQTM